MSEMGDDFRFWREQKKNLRRKLGVNCPQCAVVRPKANPSLLLPGQVCLVDGYVDPRKRAREGR